MTLARRFAIALILGSVATLTYARGNLKELTVPLRSVAFTLSSPFTLFW